MNTLKERETVPCTRCRGTGLIEKNVNRANLSHGHTSNHQLSPTYTVWHGMRQRVNNPKYALFKDYGGRGITVCERWSKFANFLADMGERPEGMSLERIDNDQGYSPENCKWASRIEQANNKRNSVFVDYNGERMTTAQWARKLGYEVHTVAWRLRQGWSVRDAITIKPSRNTPTSKGRDSRSKADELV